MIISLDLETTGLDPRKDDILEVGLVLFDPLAWPGTFGSCRTYRVMWDRLAGDPTALVMNAPLIKRIEEVKTICRKYSIDNPISGRELLALDLAKDVMIKDSVVWERDDAIYVRPEYLIPTIASWFRDLGFERVTLAGKNVASFDMSFLEAHALEYISTPLKYNRRLLDVGTLWYSPSVDGDVLPNSSAVFKRAGVTHDVTHTALQDALDVAYSIQKFYALRNQDV